MDIKREAGFSLTEVMVSLALVVTVATIFLTIYFSGVRAAKKSEDQLIAILSMRDVIEEYKSTSEIEEGTKEENGITHSVTIDKQDGDKILYLISLSANAGNKTMVLETKLYRQVSP